VADKKVTLGMRISGGGFEDLYPYELFLEEGFSRVYRARLTLLSDTLHTDAELAEIVDTGVSLTISQTLRDAVTWRTRYLHGIITAVATDGVFFSGEQHYYRYILTIESELARLRHNIRNGVYYRQSPVDAVAAVLKNNHITARFFENYIKLDNYSRRLMFNQSGSSDIDFIGNILFTYGLSFTCTHPVPPKGSVEVAQLVFSDGNSFPAPIYEYSNDRDVPEIAQFDFVRANETQSIWKMEAFRMERAIGVDGIEVSAAYPEFNYGNNEWKAGVPGVDTRSVTYNRLFTGYERGTPKDEIDADMKRILEVRLRHFALAKVRWAGKAANLLLMPGALFELAHFYGLGDKSKITALVTSAKTHVRAVWPERLAVNMDETRAGETIETEFGCIDYAPGIERRFCGTIS
jgi:uncharacterized protein involved in type VI secretion and phage assembly